MLDNDLITPDAPKTNFDAEIPEFPCLGETVIVTITDPKSIGAPLLHLPCIVTERIMPPEGDPAIWVGGYALIGPGVRRVVPGLASAPQMVPVAARYSPELRANCWLSRDEHAKLGQPLVSARVAA